MRSTHLTNYKGSTHPNIKQFTDDQNLSIILQSRSGQSHYPLPNNNCSR
ncbi:hypothetical protein [Moraxella lacunata]